MYFSSVEPFLFKVETWQKYLSTINEVLNKWWFVQQKWIYLAEIYSGKDIVYILPEEVEQFNKLNEVYKDVCILAVVLIYTAVIFAYIKLIFFL